ncbi:MAG: hypothetical protein R3C49_08600 [Planctomycetaceae bacterium]
MVGAENLDGIRTGIKQPIRCLKISGNNDWQTGRGIQRGAGPESTTLELDVGKSVVNTFDVPPVPLEATVMSDVAKMSIENVGIRSIALGHPTH